MSAVSLLSAAAVDLSSSLHSRLHTCVFGSQSFGGFDLVLSCIFLVTIDSLRDDHVLIRAFV